MIVYILNKFSRTRKMLYTLPVKYRRHLFYLYQAFTIVIFLFGVTSFLCLVFAGQIREMRVASLSHKNNSLIAGDLPTQKEYIDLVQNQDIKDLQSKRVTDAQKIEKLEGDLAASKIKIEAHDKEITQIYTFGAAVGVVITFISAGLDALKKLLAKPAELLIRKDDK